MTEERTLVSEAPPCSSRVTASVSRKVAHGTIWSVATRLASILATLLSTPFVTRLLGAELYGIWALANTILHYVSFTELGTGDASTQLAAEAYARKDEAKEVAVVWTSFLFTLIPTLAVVGVLMVAAGPLVREVFSVPSHLRGIATLAVRLTALIFLSRLFVGVFNTPLLVRLRIDLCEQINNGFVILQHFSTVIVLLLGCGLNGVLWLVVAYALVKAVTLGFASRAVLPPLFRARIDAALVKPLFRFGSYVTLSLVAGIVLTSIERLFLARYGSVQELAYYSIAASLVSFLPLIPTALRQPLLPALSTLHAEKNIVAFERLYFQAVRTTLYWAMLVAFLMCTLGEPFLRIWAGTEFAANSTILLIILAIGCACQSVSYIPHCLMTAIGKTGTIARCHMIEIGPFVASAFFLTLRFGAVGAALAASLRMLLETFLFFAAVRKDVTFNLHATTGGWRSYGVAVLILMGAALVSFFLGANPSIRIPIAIIGAAGYCGILWVKILSDAERLSILRFLRIARSVD